MQEALSAEPVGIASLLAVSLSLPGMRLCYDSSRKMNRGKQLTFTKAPSFKGLQSASLLSSRTKQSNRSVGTIHERLLQRELGQLGLSFRRNVRTLPGRPDIVFADARIAIFCDGDFWHGRDWRVLKSKLKRGSNPSYWIAKIASNRRRDRQNNRLLKQAGWRVLRFWETDIKTQPQELAKRVKSGIRSRLSQEKREYAIR